jgi:uncharacterized membrane protein YfcA
MIDGSLGMGYGVLSMTLLLATGLTPAVASATVHIAKIGTALASGVAHWRFGNVDGKVMLLLAIPGAIGAYAGAVVLSSLSLSTARPYVSILLLVLGSVIVARFLHGRRNPGAVDRPRRPRWLLAPLGLIGGFVDASGGGGWGPVTTSTLVASGQLAPRMTIGTVNAAELAVALAASVGFLQSLGSAGIRWDITAAMLVGGVLAAVPAAWLVRHLNERTLGIAVGALILLLSADSVLTLLNLPTDLLMAIRVIGLVLTGALFAAAFVRGRMKTRDADRDDDAATGDTPGAELDRGAASAD